MKLFAAAVATMLALSSSAFDQSVALDRCEPLVVAQASAAPWAGDGVEQFGPEEHGGGLNACGCHFNHKTGECHCHQPQGCGCACQPATCP